MKILSMRQIRDITKTGKIILSLGFIGYVLFPASAFAATANTEINKLEATEKVVPQVVRPVVRYTQSDKKDPFRGYRKKLRTASDLGPVKEIQPPVMTIQGLIWGTTTPQAIIDGKIVKIGDVVSDAHIVDITKQGVEIMFEGRRFNVPAPALKNVQDSQPGPKGGTHEK